MAISPQLVAGINFAGLLLDALGGLYLAYDLLGGEKGPLRVVTRIATYTLILGTVYSIALGLKFGLIAGPGLGTAIGLQIRQFASGQPETARFKLAIALLRAGTIGLAVGVSHSVTLGLVFTAIMLGLALLLNKLGIGPDKFYKPGTRPKFNKGVLLIITVLTGCAYLLSIIGEAITHQTLSTQVISVCAAVAIGTALVATLSPVIEYWADRLPEKTMGTAGCVMFLIGIAIQSLPYVMTLLEIPQ